MNGARTGNAAIPARVGGSRAPFSFYLGAFAVGAVGSAIATQLVAYRLADNPSLGPPLLRLPLAGGLYAAWAWASWTWQFANPFASLQYPPVVIGALATLPFTLGGTAAAARGLLLAANPGVRGVMATIHADSALDTLQRVEDLLRLAGVPAIRRTIARFVQLVVHLGMTPDRSQRYVAEVVRVLGVDDAGEYRLKAA